MSKPDFTDLDIFFERINISYSITNFLNFS